MNETIESVFGILVGVLIGAAVLLPAIITVRAQYRKLRAAWAEARLESQSEAIAAAPSEAGQATNPRRWVFIVIPLLVIGWGLVTGFGVGVLSQFFYVLFLIPLAMGIGSGWGILDATSRLKLRATLPVLLLSLLSAVVVYGSFHYTRYLGFLLQMSFEIYEGFSEAASGESLQVTKGFADYALQEETGLSGFPGYMLYSAREGLTVGRWYRTSRTDLGPILTPLYWLLEFAIILGVTVFMGKSTRSGAVRETVHKGVCESCGSRLGGEKHLGGTAPANESTLLDLIRQKDFAGMGKLVQPDTGVPSLEVYYRGCTACGKSPSQLVVRHAFQTSQGRLGFTDASRTSLQSGESALLLSQFSFSGD